jgi:hypothetical protein
MDPRSVARIIALGRVAFGVALMAVPDKSTSAWLGADAERPGTQVAVGSVGARDLALGLGGVAALSGGSGARPWLLAGALADLSDLAGTLKHRDALPATGVMGVSALAAGAAAAGLWAAAQVD